MNRSAMVAEAVKDILTDTSYSIEFTATRSYRVYYALKDLKTLRVTVIAPLVEQSDVSRRGNVDVITVNIVVQKQVDPTNDAAIDLLADLTEEIADSFRSTHFKKWIWLDTKIVTPYDPEDLSEWRTFTSVVELRYQIAWVK